MILVAASTSGPPPLLRTDQASSDAVAQSLWNMQPLVAPPIEAPPSTTAKAAKDMAAPTQDTARLFIPGRDGRPALRVVLGGDGLLATRLQPPGGMPPGASAAADPALINTEMASVEHSTRGCPAFSGCAAPLPEGGSGVKSNTPPVDVKSPPLNLDTAGDEHHIFSPLFLPGADLALLFDNSAPRQIGLPGELMNWFLRTEHGGSALHSIPQGPGLPLSGSYDNIDWFVNEGDHVTKGQVIGQLRGTDDGRLANAKVAYQNETGLFVGAWKGYHEGTTKPAEQKLQAASRQVELDRQQIPLARRAVADAARELDRYAALQSQGAVSAASLQIYRTALTTAQASLVAAHKTLAADQDTEAQMRANLAFVQLPKTDPTTFADAIESGHDPKLISQLPSELRTAAESLQSAANSLRNAMVLVAAQTIRANVTGEVIDVATAPPVTQTGLAPNTASQRNEHIVTLIRPDERAIEARAVDPATAAAFEATQREGRKVLAVDQDGHRFLGDVGAVYAPDDPLDTSSANTLGETVVAHNLHDASTGAPLTAKSGIYRLYPNENIPIEVADNSSTNCTRSPATPGSYTTQFLPQRETEVVCRTDIKEFRTEFEGQAQNGDWLLFPRVESRVATIYAGARISTDGQTNTHVVPNSTWAYMVPLPGSNLSGGPLTVNVESYNDPNITTAGGRTGNNTSFGATALKLLVSGGTSNQVGLNLGSPKPSDLLPANPATGLVPSLTESRAEPGSGILSVMTIIPTGAVDPSKPVLSVHATPSIQLRPTGVLTQPLFKPDASQF